MKERMTPTTCMDCRFWVGLEYGDDAVYYGRCHLAPVTSTKSFVSIRTGKRVALMGFPATASHDWCGQAQARVDG